ncbi:MAG: adenylyltransferase/cytidyltransferase family protein, partial [Muribaculaceae bacterium]
MSEKVAVFPGSFDPFTIGPLSVAERASGLSDSIVIAIGINDKKTSQNTVAERIEQISRSVSHIGNVRVASYSGLTVAKLGDYGPSWRIMRPCS